MMFRDLKAGDSLYIFDRSNATFTTGQVMSCKEDNSTPSVPNYNYMQPMPKKVSVGVSCNGKDMTYVFDDNLETGFVGDVVITASKDRITQQINLFRENCEKVVKNIDVYKTNIEKCNKVLADIDPSIRERQLTEGRIDKLENSVNEIKGMFKELMENIKKE